MMKKANVKPKLRIQQILTISFLLFISLNLISIPTYAQVTIGSNLEPEKAAILDLKEKEDKDGGPTAEKGGLILPRVNLEKKKQLYPFIREKGYSASNYDDASYDPNVADPDYAKEKPAHKGLVVYNLKEDDDEELCLGFNQWDGEQWNCFEQKASSALFSIDCSSLKVMGDYGDGIALNSSNYIKVSITITRPGAYSISAASNPDNGYFYETTGTFYTTGTFPVTIPGTGQPVNHTQGTNLIDPSDDTPDKFTLSSSGGGADCSFEVNVRSTAAHPEFTIDCSATVVEGMYFEDQALSSTPNPINGESHRIKVTLKNIPASAFGAIAQLQTNEVDGFSFKGEGVLTSSTQDFYLQGTGTPRGLSDKIFTITSNSESSSASCTATVHMLIPRKRLLTIGMDYPSYGYNLGQPTSRTSTTLGYTSGNDLLTDKNNFGYNQWSIQRFAGFSNLGTGTASNTVTNINTWTDDNRDIICLYTAGWQSMKGVTLQGLLKGTNGQPKIDIVMIGHDTAEYFRSGNSDDDDKAAALIEFVKSGGILMICSERPISNGNFLRKFFDNSNIGSASGAGPGSLYTLGFNNDNTPNEMKPYYCKDEDPILAGPFENIVGRHWGEDASNTVYITNLPLDDIIIYSGARPLNSTAYPAEAVTIFRHREYPFVFVGDGGFNSNEVRTFTGLTVCPFRLTNKNIGSRAFTHWPTYRTYGTSTGRAYNALFTANAFAWCIQTAEALRKQNK